MDAIEIHNNIIISFHLASTTIKLQKWIVIKSLLLIGLTLKQFHPRSEGSTGSKQHNGFYLYITYVAIMAFLFFFDEKNWSTNNFYFVNLLLLVQALLTFLTFLSILADVHAHIYVYINDKKNITNSLLDILSWFSFFNVIMYYYSAH